MADLEAGLEHSVLTGHIHTAVVRFDGKMMSSSEEGQQGDQAKIVKILITHPKTHGRLEPQWGWEQLVSDPPCATDGARSVFWWAGGGGSLVEAVLALRVITAPGLSSRPSVTSVGQRENGCRPSALVQAMSSDRVP